MRRRVRTEATWDGSKWLTNQIVRYVYDGNLVIQERDVWNLPQVSYTRGKDLSGSFEGAGGIGGLLARTDHSTLNSQPSAARAYYFADGNGHVAMLINTQQLAVAKYQYDPFGNALSLSGPLAEANLYRFSSKERHENSRLIYYLYRYYSPDMQRWLNTDPIEEAGGLNLHAFDGNDLINFVDSEGLGIFGQLKCAWRVRQWQKQCEGAIPNCPLWECPQHGDDGVGCEEARRQGILDCARQAKKMMKDCLKGTMTPPKPKKL